MSNELTQANEETPTAPTSKMEKAFLEDLDAYINQRLTVYHLHHTNMNAAEREAKMKEGEDSLAEARKDLELSLRHLIIHGSKRPGV